MKTDFSLERFNRLFRLEMKRDSRTNLMWLAVIFGLFILLAVQLTASASITMPTRILKCIPGISTTTRPT